MEEFSCALNIRACRNDWCDDARDYQEKVVKIAMKESMK